MQNELRLRRMNWLRRHLNILQSKIFHMQSISSVTAGNGYHCEQREPAGIPTDLLVAAHSRRAHSRSQVLPSTFSSINETPIGVSLSVFRFAGREKPYRKSTWLIAPRSKCSAGTPTDLLVAAHSRRAHSRSQVLPSTFSSINETPIGVSLSVFRFAGREKPYRKSTWQYFSTILSCGGLLIQRRTSPCRCRSRGR